MDRQVRRDRALAERGAEVIVPLLLTSFQNCYRRGMDLGMAEADEHDAAIAFFQKPFAFVVQNDIRLSAGLAPDFHIVPAQLRADAGAKRFGDGLLRSESCREKWPGCLVRQTITDFRRMQDTIEKSLAEFFVRRRDAVHFNNIYANSKDHISAFISLHRCEHLLHGLRDAHHNRAAHDAVADVQLDEMRHVMQQTEIFVIEAMPGVHLQAE